MGTSGQRIRLFYYTRYRGLWQSVFALQYENLQPRLRVLQGFHVCFAQPPLNKNRHRNLPATRANLCACFTCSGRSVSSVQEQDGSPLHGQVGRPEGQSPFGSGFPIGAGSTPVGTRFSVGKSSVLYLCFRMTRERGWLRHLLYGQIAVDRHFSAAVGQADFVTPR